MSVRYEAVIDKSEEASFRGIAAQNGATNISGQEDNGQLYISFDISNRQARTVISELKRNGFTATPGDSKELKGLEWTGSRTRE